MFIEVSKGHTVNLDSVTEIQERDGGKSLIYLGKSSIASDIPYKTLVSILKSDANVASKKIVQGLEAFLQNYGQPSP